MEKIYIFNFFLKKRTEILDLLITKQHKYMVSSNRRNKKLRSAKMYGKRNTKITG